jgi:alpha-tubulin suppressor-like RCC1 family protein
VLAALIAIPSPADEEVASGSGSSPSGEQWCEMKAAKKSSAQKRSKAVAFGRGYFHALGGTEAGKAEDEKGVVIPYSSWDSPPWIKSDRDGAEDDIQTAVATAQSTIFLTKSGNIYQTGTVHGQIFENPSPVITRLPLPCVEISAGRHFCLGRIKGGVAVVSWGAGHFGQLGVSTPDADRQTTYSSQPMVIQHLLPHAIGSPIKQVAAGDWHALALTESGRVWAWGSNRSHQCGRKPSSRNNSQATTLLNPMPIPLDVKVEQIAAGRSHSVAITQDTHQVYCWGSTLHGQCGNVVRKTPVSPHMVEGLAELSFQKISAAGNHTLALTSGGRLFSWGDNSEGQLGHSPPCPAQPRARQVSELDFVAVAAAHDLKKDPLAAEKLDLKQQSDLLKAVPKIVNVFAGASYSVATSSSGHVYCFGSNDVGQLGMPVPLSPTLEDNTAPLNKTAMVHEVNVCAFDSRHIILLPVRNSLVDDLFVDTVACGPNHMWCIGRDRTEADLKLLPGRMLREAKLQTARGGKSITAISPNSSTTVVSPSASTDNIIEVFMASPLPLKVETTSVPSQVEQEQKEEAEVTSLTMDGATSLVHTLPEVQTAPNALADSLVPINIPPTPSTFGEVTSVGLPSPSSEHDTVETPSPVKSSKAKKGGGLIRGLSKKFRRRFGGKKRQDEDAEAEVGSR